MIYGYAGNTLRIDLSNNNIVKEPLKQEWVDEYIGGRGFVAKILYDENPPEVDPFDEENLFIIAMGPLSGHFLPASGKTHFGTKSPLTGGYGDSNMGGHFGVNMKYAGYDVTIIKGKAEKPSCIIIDDDKVEIRNAEKYWGKGSLTVEEEMKEDLGEDFEILTIGPAGENLVKIACISHDFGRQAGRIGIGAVLGSKNIKAIAVRGTKSVPVFDPEELLKKGKETYDAIRAKPGFKAWTPQGTAGITGWTNNVGALPVRNFQTSYFEHVDKINGEAVVRELKITDKACFSCPVPCGKYGYAKTKLGNVYVEGPEFETIALIGSNNAIENIHEIAYLNYLCDELGLDTMSGGSVASFAIECYEKGLITKEEMGMDVKFGDFESVAHILNLIAKREGLGDILAEGTRTASEKIGNDSSKFAMQIKGLEVSGYETRNAPGMTLSYMTSDIGGDHARNWVLGNDVAGSAESAAVSDLITGEQNVDKLPKASHKNVAQIVIKSQNLRPSFDVLGICRLQYMEIGLEIEYYEDLLYAVTGKKITWDDLFKLSEKIWNLTRMYNFREIRDFGRKYDYPPARFYEEPVPSGPNKGHKLSLDEINEMLDDYYEARGWDDNGKPTEETLKRVALILK